MVLAWEEKEWNERGGRGRNGGCGVWECVRMRGGAVKARVGRKRRRMQGGCTQRGTRGAMRQGREKRKTKEGDTQKKGDPEKTELI